MVAEQCNMQNGAVEMGVRVVSKLNLREIAECIFGAHVVGCAVKSPPYYMPAQMVAIPAAVLPFVSFLTQCQANLCTPDPGKRLSADTRSDSSET